MANLSQMSIFSQQVLQEAVKKFNLPVSVNPKEIQRFLVELTRSKGDCHGILYSRQSRICAQQCIVAPRCRDLTYGLVTEVASLLAENVDLEDLFPKQTFSEPEKTTAVQEIPVELPEDEDPEQALEIIKTQVRTTFSDENIEVQTKDGELQLVQGNKKFFSITQRRKGFQLVLHTVPNRKAQRFLRLGFEVDKKQINGTTLKRNLDLRSLLSSLNIYFEDVYKHIT